MSKTLNNSEIRQNIEKFREAIDEINKLAPESKSAMENYLQSFNSLISQYNTLFGKDYDEIKNKLHNTTELGKKFVEMTNDIESLKDELKDLDDKLSEQRKTYLLTAEEQKNCIKYAKELAKITNADEYVLSQEKLDNAKSGVKYTEEELETAKDVVKNMHMQMRLSNVMTDQQRKYVIDILQRKNAKLNDTLDILTKIDDTQTNIQSKELEILRTHQEENRVIERRGKIYDNITKAVSGGLHIIKKWGSEWATFNDLSVKSGRAIGMNNENLRNYNLKLIKDTTQLSHLYGITREQWIGFQNAYAESTSKATLLSRNEIENIGAVSKLTSDDIVNQAIANIDLLGGSSDNAMAQVAMTHQRAMQLGLNASKLAKDTVKNWGLAQKFTFKNGVDGISRMTALSERLKFNMESIAQVAEGLQSVEGSIQTASRLQMLGGQYARNFSNPMDIMYESNYDMEGLTERIARTFEGQGVFNTKTGKVDISAINQRFIREAAKAMGMSADEAFNITTQNAKYNQVVSEASPLANFDENQKQLIANLAKWDSKNKTHYLTIQGENGETKNVDVKDLTAKDLENASQLDENTANINQNVYDIKNGVNQILDLAKQRANDQRSWIEKILGLNESYKGAASTGADYYMNPLDTKVGEFTNRNGKGTNIFGFDVSSIPIANYLSEHGLAMLGVLGLSTAFQLGKGMLFKKHNGSMRQAFRDWVIRSKTPKQKAAVSGGSVPSGTSNGLWSKTKNFGKAAGRYAWNGVKGLGRGVVNSLKKNKKTALAVAAVGGMLGLSSFSNNPNEEATTTPTNTNQLNQAISNDPTLNELKKQTGLLEDISQGGVIGGSSTNNSAKSKIVSETQSSSFEKGIMNVDSVIGGNDSTITDVAVMGGVQLGANKAGSYIMKKAAPLAAKSGAMGKVGSALVKGGSLAKGLGGGLTGIAGYGIDAANNFMIDKGLYKKDSTADKVVSIGADALKYAGLGSMFGPWGTAIGGLVGAGIGVYKRYGDSIKNWIKGKTDNVEEGQASNMEKVMNEEYNANAVPLNKDNDMRQMSLYRNIENPYLQSLPVVGQPTNIVQNTYRETVTEKIVVPDINVNVNGTIKLSTDSGKSADIDLDKLMNNPQFKNMIVKMVKDGLDKNQNNGKIDRNSLSNQRVSSGYSNK